MESNSSSAVAKKCILLVDNEPVWYELIGTHLRKEGYDVVIADSRPAAIDQLRQRSALLMDVGVTDSMSAATGQPQHPRPFDLVLTNLHLKQSSLGKYSKVDFEGVHVIEAVHEYAPGTPCIVISGHPDRLHENLARFSEWCADLHKNTLSLDELAETIRQVIEYGVIKLRLVRIEGGLTQDPIPTAAIDALIAVLKETPALSDTIPALGVRLNLLREFKRQKRELGGLTVAQERDRREAIHFAIQVCRELEELDTARRGGTS